MKPLLVNVNELLRRPGNERDIATVATAGELDVNDPKVAADSDVTIGLHLESLSDGLVVTGLVQVPWSAGCHRCLEPIERVAQAHVQELFQYKVTDPDAYRIVGDQIDLTTMVREVALVEIPASVLCRSDCAGLCPGCGIDRNFGSCDCTFEVADPRWAGLEALRDTLG